MVANLDFQYTMSCPLWVKLVFFFSSILDDYDFFFLAFCMGLNFQFIVAKKYESRQLCLVLTLWEKRFIFYRWVWCSVGKESTCNAGDPSSIPGSRTCPGEGIEYPLQYSWASLVAQLVKNPPAILEDIDSIPGLGRSPGKGKGYPLQYSGLENHSRTWLSDFHFHSLSSWKMKVRSTLLHSSLPKYIKYISISYELIVHKTNSFFKS